MSLKLNGWQRLWVLLSVLWGATVVVITYLSWPTAANVRVGDVYTHIGAEQGSAIFDFYAVLAHESGGEEVLLSTDPSAGLPMPSTGAPLAIVKSEPLPVRGQTVDVEGHLVTLIGGLSEPKANAVAAAYYRTLRSLVARKRLVVAKWAAVALVLPPSAVYVLGWGIAWVIRGFRSTV